MRSLKDAIADNRVRQHKLRRARMVLHGVRLRMFEYEDQGDARMLEKARRVIARCEATIQANRWKR
jgi:hypothetical protein